MESERDPNARTEGYSMRGSQAKSVALKFGGTLIGGNRFFVSGPVRTASLAAARQARDATNRSVTARRRGAVRFLDGQGAISSPAGGDGRGEDAVTIEVIAPSPVLPSSFVAREGEEIVPQLGRLMESRVLKSFTLIETM